MAHFEFTLLRHCQRKAGKHKTQNVLKEGDIEKCKIPEWVGQEMTTDKQLSERVGSMRNQWQQGKIIILGPHWAELDAPKPGHKDFVFPQLPQTPPA